jgi:hypothetical protein
MFKKKYDTGKEIRGKVPRSGHAKWKAPHNRPSVKKMIQLSDYDRLPDLTGPSLPYERFAFCVLPGYGFYYGTGSFIYTFFGDHYTGLRRLPFNEFRRVCNARTHLIMDINDLMKTTSGYWEWDIKRLTTSFILAAREKQFSEKKLLKKLQGNCFPLTRKR